MRPTRSSATRAALATSVLVMLGACASAGRPPALGDRARAPTPTTSRASYIISATSLPRDRLLIDEIAARWPRLVRGDLPRGDEGVTWTLDRFAVYDARGGFLGGPEYLASVRAGDVQEVRRLTSGEEYAKFGRRHPAGAVVLTWRLGTR